MCLFQQNQPEEARKLFSQAQIGMPPLPADERKPLANGQLAYPNLLMYWLALKEASACWNELEQNDFDAARSK